MLAGWAREPAEEEKRTMKALRLAWLAVLGGLTTMTMSVPAHAERGVGACCMDDGTCEMGSELICLLAGGDYQGDGTDCETVDCWPRGACCFLDLSCQILKESECLAQGGVYQGHETDCVTGACPVSGACCLSDGSCARLTHDECMAAGGTYQGFQTECAAVDCLGACCFYTGKCLDGISPGSCDYLLGQYQGHGTDCQSVDCSTIVQEGTFSFDQNNTQILTFEKFDDLNGARILKTATLEFTGAVHAMVVLTNLGNEGIPTGVTVDEALFLWDFPALDVPVAVIDIADDVIYCYDEFFLLPPGESCDFGGLLSWPEDWPAGFVRVIDQPGDLAEFIGDGIFDAIVEGVGSFRYAGSLYRLTNSPHRVEGAIKLTYDYEWLGACCFYDGSCQLLTEEECDALSEPISDDPWSMSWSKGEFCEDVFCPSFGACCVHAGCIELPMEACAQEGGDFQGEGSNCETASCPGVPWGACCFEDGSCNDGLNEGQCRGAGGVYMGNGSHCSYVDCPWLLPPPGVSGNADLDRDNVVAAEDLLILLAAWGVGDGPADLDRNGVVDARDLVLLLGAWGPCTP